MTTNVSQDQWLQNSNGVFEFQDPTPNDITCLAGGEEMLRIGPDGFWVRGVKIEQGPGEAQAVYQAMKEFLIWSQLTRP